MRKYNIEGVRKNLRMTPWAIKILQLLIIGSCIGCGVAREWEGIPVLIVMDVWMTLVLLGDMARWRSIIEEHERQEKESP